MKYYIIFYISTDIIQTARPQTGLAFLFHEISHSAKVCPTFPNSGTGHRGFMNVMDTMDVGSCCHHWMNVTS